MVYYPGRRAHPAISLLTYPILPPMVRATSLVDPVAQSVEHVTFNHGVVGSNPTGITIEQPPQAH